MAQSPSTSDLQVLLRDGADSNCIKATVRNGSPFTTYTLLAWDTVLDDISPLAKGTLGLSRKDSGEVVEGPGVLINRAMPPRREDLIEIAPQSEVSKSVVIQGPWLPHDGQEYTIKAGGSWRSVWPKSAQQVTDGELAELGGPDAVQGDYSSNSVIVTLS